MAQWGRNDEASNSVIWAPALLNKEPTRANANALFGNTTGNGYITYATHGVFGVSDDEANTVSVAGAGWQLRTTGHGGRAGRVTYETLVAMSSFTGDANDSIDNYIIIINTQPQDSEVTEGDPTNFSVTAVSSPAGATLTYQWQMDADANGTFANISEAGVYSNVDTATLSISNTSGLTENAAFRVIVGTDDATSVTSDPAYLTFA